jgi:Zn-dependent protease with chaperone function
VFAAICGFGGALISLALSKWTAKRMMGVRVITTPQSDLEGWLIATIKRLADQVHIGMPEVGIFDAAEMNLCHRRAPQRGLGGREQRPAARHVPPADRSGIGSRNKPCGKR